MQEKCKKGCLEHIELVVAWLKDEITSGQVGEVLGIKKAQGSTILYKLALIIKYGIQTNKIKLNK